MSAYRRVAFCMGLAVATVGLGNAAYIPAKAWLAQVLLDSAWTQRQRDGTRTRPWPWADMAPIARIRQPRLGIDQIVLDDASGRALAFGPGHVRGSASPGQLGNIVISAHRDTHFAWLRELVRDDIIVVESQDGGERTYRVAERGVHHADETHLLAPHGADRLRLITCYPFRAVDPGTPWRYVVTALPLLSPRVATAPADVSRPLRL